MNRPHILLALLLAATAMAASQSTAQPKERVSFGVLAFRGEAHAKQRWGATTEYLSASLPGYAFDLVPLTLDGTDAALDAQGLHFLLTNPGHYQYLMGAHGLAPLASLQTDFPGMVATGNRYGAVIFARAGDHAPVRLADLEGAVFGAVAPEAFGGWQLALHTFRRQGIEPQNDFAEVKYFGFPQTSIVEAVVDGDIDAGTVRTGVIESMVADGRISEGDLVVLNPIQVPDFGFALSTALVPEWLIATTPQAGPKLRKEVAQALLAVEPELSNRIGWLPPQSLAPVLAIQSTLATEDTRVSKTDLPQWLSIAALFISLALVSVLTLRIFSRRNWLHVDHSSGPEETLADTGPESELTPRELEVLDLIEHGLTSKEIARKLDISPKTVEFHRHNLLQKFAATNMADLVHRSGLWKRAEHPRNPAS